MSCNGAISEHRVNELFQPCHFFAIMKAAGRPDRGTHRNAVTDTIEDVALMFRETGNAEP